MNDLPDAKRYLWAAAAKCIGSSGNIGDASNPNITAGVCQCSIEQQPIVVRPRSVVLVIPQFHNQIFGESRAKCLELGAKALRGIAPMNKDKTHVNI